MILNVEGHEIQIACSSEQHMETEPPDCVVEFCIL